MRYWIRLQQHRVEFAEVLVDAPDTAAATEQALSQAATLDWYPGAVNTVPEVYHVEAETEDNVEYHGYEIQRVNWHDWSLSYDGLHIQYCDSVPAAKAVVDALRANA